MLCLGLNKNEANIFARNGALTQFITAKKVGDLAQTNLQRWCVKMDKTTINLYRGDDEECIVRLFEKQLDDKLKPLDLSNMARFDLWATVRNKPVLTLSSTTGEIEVVDAPGGVLKVTFSHSLTKDATWSQADYDLQAVSNKGRVKTPIQGGRINLKFDVTPDMTGGRNG